MENVIVIQAKEETQTNPIVKKKKKEVQVVAHVLWAKAMTHVMTPFFFCSVS